VRYSHNICLEIQMEGAPAVLADGGVLRSNGAKRMVVVVTHPEITSQNATNNGKVTLALGLLTFSPPPSRSRSSIRMGRIAKLKPAAKSKKAAQFPGLSTHSAGSKGDVNANDTKNNGHDHPQVWNVHPLPVGERWIFFAQASPRST
jgi:hypothetical protein